MKTITTETAFVVRTFFFIIFGWSVYLGSLLSLKVVGIGLLLVVLIYVIRWVFLVLFTGFDVFPQVFLAPRGLITILLFFAIPESISLGFRFQGVLLFVILLSCLIMSFSLIYQKRRVDTLSSVDEELEGVNEELEEGLAVAQNTEEPSFEETE